MDGWMGRIDDILLKQINDFRTRSFDLSGLAEEGNGEVVVDVDCRVWIKSFSVIGDDSCRGS